MALIAQLPENGTVMLGENILDLEDRTALSRWCRYAVELTSELFVGAQERSNRATIRRWYQARPSSMPRTAIGTSNRS